MTTPSEDAVAFDRYLEGSTGKRARHVKVRSLDDVGSAWLRAAIDAQIALRAEAATARGRTS